MNLDAMQMLFIILIALMLIDAVKDIIVVWHLFGRLPYVPTPQPQPPALPPPTETPIPPTPIPTPPAPTAGPHQTNITATYFTDKLGAYGPIGPSVPGVALPAAFASPRPKVRVSTLDGSRSVVCDIVDKGPWNVNDPYWTTGSRPQAETGTDQRGRTTNRAGIDLTPPAVSALGFNEATGKWIVNWDFADARTQEPSQAPVGATTLQPNSWPTQAECPSFYGDSEASIRAQLVSVHVPWLMNGKTQTIEIHQKCAASLNRVLNYIWEQCGKSQDQIHSFGYDVFDGSFNWRPIRGGSGRSVHSYAAAIDFDAAQNPQLAPPNKTVFKEDSLITHAFKAESWIWGGDWVTPRDAMHFQAARVR